MCGRLTFDQAGLASAAGKGCKWSNTPEGLGGCRAFVLPLKWAGCVAGRTPSKGASAGLGRQDLASNLPAGRPKVRLRCAHITRGSALVRSGAPHFDDQACSATSAPAASPTVLINGLCMSSNAPMPNSNVRGAGPRFVGGGGSRRRPRVSCRSSPSTRTSAACATSRALQTQCYKAPGVALGATPPTGSAVRASPWLTFALCAGIRLWP